MTPHGQRFLDALTQKGCRPRVRTDQIRAHCPGSAHRRGDRKPSLSATDHPDKLLFQCFVCGRAGQGEILSALGLTYADLFATSSLPAAPQTTRRRRVAQYGYESAAGVLLSRKIRYEPKMFRWQSPDPQARGGLAWRKHPGVTVYRLPHLIDERVVVVVEGEKAVDRLSKLGVAATCPPTGSNEWTDTFMEAIWRAGAHTVVVIADNDRPGKDHANRVVRACHGYRPAFASAAASDEPWASWPCADPDDPEVQLLRAKLLILDDLPYHGDVCDWLDAGHSAAEMRALIAAAPDLNELEQAKRDHKRRVDRDRQRRHRAKRRQQARDSLDAPSRSEGPQDLSRGEGTSPPDNQQRTYVHQRDSVTDGRESVDAVE